MRFKYCDWCKAEEEIKTIMEKYDLDSKALDDALDYFCEDDCESKRSEKIEEIENMRKSIKEINLNLKVKETKESDLIKYNDEKQRLLGEIKKIKLEFFE